MGGLKEVIQWGSSGFGMLLKKNLGLMKRVKDVGKEAPNPVCR